jgi:hypothetical protein
MASQVLQVFDKEWKTARPEAGGRWQNEKGRVK